MPGKDGRGVAQAAPAGVGAGREEFIGVVGDPVEHDLDEAGTGLPELFHGFELGEWRWAWGLVPWSETCNEGFDGIVKG